MKTLITIIMVLAINFIADAQADFSSSYKLKNYDEVNTYHHEFSYIPIENQLYIISSARGMKNRDGIWHGAKELELFVYDQNKFVPFAKDLNQAYSSGSISILSKSKFYFTGSNVAPKVDPKTQLPTYSHNIIAEYVTENGHDFKIVPVTDFVDDKYSYKDPSISTDGRFLYFSSDIPGGYGGFDLYMSYYEDGKWSAPKNLGNTVNSEKDETAPFYHEKSGKVFFTSNGHDTCGGMDIFYCSNQGDTWTNAVNLGNSINSSANETSIYFNDVLTYGFVASDRKSGKGGFDIYEIIWK